MCSIHIRDLWIAFLPSKQQEKMPRAGDPRVRRLGGLSHKAYLEY
jgi:hypothetical protein